jgi:serine/threonine protein kinase
MIALGADVNAFPPNRESACHVAAKLGNADIMRALIDAGANVRAGGHCQRAPLHLAANGRVAQMLIDAGAYVDVPDRFLSTPCHLAAGANHLDVVQTLLANRANVNAVDNDGKTPLQRSTDRRIAQFLIAAGAHVAASSLVVGEAPFVAEPRRPLRDSVDSPATFEAVSKSLTAVCAARSKVERFGMVDDFVDEIVSSTGAFEFVDILARTCVTFTGVADQLDSLQQQLRDATELDNEVVKQRNGAHEALHVVANAAVTMFDNQKILSVSERVKKSKDVIAEWSVEDNDADADNNDKLAGNPIIAWIVAMKRDMLVFAESTDVCVRELKDSLVSFSNVLDVDVDQSASVELASAEAHLKVADDLDDIEALTAKLAQCKAAHKLAAQEVTGAVVELGAMLVDFPELVLRFPSARLDLLMGGVGIGGDAASVLRTLDSYDERTPIAGTRHTVERASIGGQACALKLFTLGNNEQRAFLKEARQLRHLAHPNVVQLRAAFVHQQFGVIEMPLYEFGSLWKWRAAAQRSDDDMITVLRQTLCGLEHVHRMGVVHADVKPDNVFVGADGVARLGDFDVSQEDQSSSTRTMTRVGMTDFYCAPELERKLWAQSVAKPSKASDVFAFGLTMFDIMCGSEQQLLRPIALERLLLRDVAVTGWQPDRPGADRSPDGVGGARDERFCAAASRHGCRSRSSTMLAVLRSVLGARRHSL